MFVVPSKSLEKQWEIGRFRRKCDSHRGSEQAQCLDLFHSVHFSSFSSCLPLGCSVVVANTYWRKKTLIYLSFFLSYFLEHISFIWKFERDRQGGEKRARCNRLTNACFSHYVRIPNEWDVIDHVSHAIRAHGESGSRDWHIRGANEQVANTCLSNPGSVVMFLAVYSWIDR
jgi:hypothetical protein